MPPLDAFPKSHIVTFKYYVGIIVFLEEDYIKVGYSLPHPLYQPHNPCLHRDRQKTI